MLSLISNATCTVFVLCVTALGHALVFIELWHAYSLIAYMIYSTVRVYYVTQVLYIHLSSPHGPVPIWLSCKYLFDMLNVRNIMIIADLVEFLIYC